MDIPLPGGGVEGSEDYSPAATVVSFDRPLPLLRAPVPSSAPGDPPVLAFRDAASWRAAWEAAEASLFSQCELAELPCASHARQQVYQLRTSKRADKLLTTEAGARSGCSITATRKCKVPWWKGLFGGATTDYQARTQCEEREMASCLESAKEACIKFSKEKCNAPFRDASIASEGLLENTDFAVWGAELNRTASASLSVGNSQYYNPGPGATNYKGSDLLDSLAPKDSLGGDD